MNGFFKPLIRKIGAATLVIACLFTAGWIHTNGYCDCFTLNFSKRVQFNVTSDWQLLELHCVFGRKGYDDEPFVDWLIGANAVLDKPLRTRLSEQTAEFIKWTIRGYGFAMGTMLNRSGEDNYYFVVPYWSIVVPLALLSAYLLLSKPKNPKPTTEPPV